MTTDEPLGVALMDLIHSGCTVVQARCESCRTIARAAIHIEKLETGLQYVRDECLPYGLHGLDDARAQVNELIGPKETA